MQWHLCLNRAQEFLSARITEWLWLGETSGGHLVQPPASAGSHRPRCPDPRPGGF